MRYLAIGNSICPATVEVSDKSGCVLDGFSFRSSNFTGKRNVRDLRVMSVATHRLPEIDVAPPSSREKQSDHGNWNHVAWTSVRQERWEGELAVEGEIPLWLVCPLYFFFFFLKSFFIIIITFACSVLK